MDKVVFHVSMQNREKLGRKFKLKQKHRTALASSAP